MSVRGGKLVLVLAVLAVVLITTLTGLAWRSGPPRRSAWPFFPVDVSDSGVEDVPWSAYNSSDAAVEVPHDLSWMLDADEMLARARDGLVDMGVARRLADVVSATYCSPENLAAWNCSRCSDDLESVTLTWDPQWDLLGVVGWSKALDGIVISFRGTDSHSYYNWVENMRTWRTDLSLSYEGMPEGALVHGGFFFSYTNSSLAGDVARAVQGIIAERGERGGRGGRGDGGGGGSGWDGRADRGPNVGGVLDGSGTPRGRKFGGRNGGMWAEGGSGASAPGDAAFGDRANGGNGGNGGNGEPPPARHQLAVSPTVFVSGHSLGGALATFCALEMKLVAKIDDVRVVTFGSPRVGNAIFAEWFKATVPQNVRFTHNRDMIPSLPPMYMGFSHIPQEVWLVDVVPSRTLVGVCDESGEDPRCHRGACSVFGVGSICVSLADHLGYLSPMYQPRPNGC